MELEIGYYRINGTKRILYCDSEKWMKPAKDNRKSYSGWVSHLDKQPKMKSVEVCDLSEVK
jgi:hypothetical protein